MSTGTVSTGGVGICRRVCISPVFEDSRLSQSTLSQARLSHTTFDLASSLSLTKLATRVHDYPLTVVALGHFWSLISLLFLSAKPGVVRVLASQNLPLSPFSLVAGVYDSATIYLSYVREVCVKSSFTDRN